MFDKDTIEDTALSNAGARGALGVLNELLELDYEEFRNGLSDE